MSSLLDEFKLTFPDKNEYSRTWKMVDKRGATCLRVWTDKYGSLNKAQREYADQLLCHCLTYARTARFQDKRYAYFQAESVRVLNHERVHDGFKRRATSLATGILDTLPNVFQEAT